MERIPVNPELASNIIRNSKKLLALSLKGKNKKIKMQIFFFLTTKCSGSDFPLFAYLHALNRVCVKNICYNKIRNGQLTN